MRLLQLLALFISLMLVSTHNKDKQRHGDQNCDDDQASKLSEAYMRFAVTLYKHASSKIARAPMNIFISPLSVSASLTMLALGAKSLTRQQILESMFLNVNQGNSELNTEFEKLLAKLWKQDKTVELYLGNWFFLQKTIDVAPKYKQDIANYYNGSIESINFNDPKKAEMKINDYVRSQMGGKVGDLVSDLNSQTMLILIDVMSCSAKLLSPFTTHNTEDMDFDVTSQRTVRVPMLHRVGLYKTFQDEELHNTVVEVPCAGNIVMLLIVPKLGELHKLEDVITKELIKKYLKETKTSTVDFCMPKLSYAARTNLEYPLAFMGITHIFSDSADFSGISKQSRLKVNQIYHKALLNISEEENEAIGGTVTQSYAVTAPAKLKVNRPFLALLYSKAADTILLMGRVMDPSM